MQAAFERGDFLCWRYDARYARRATDPGELCRGARSVICIALPYATPGARGCEPLRGRVSNYAWSGDYHRRLRALLGGGCDADRRRRGSTGHRDRVRYQPLAERALAARAGLGWVGKHTNLIVAGARFVRLSRRDRDDARTSARRAAAQELRLVRRCVDACPTQRAARRLHDRRDSLHLRPHAAHGRDSAAMRPLIGDWVWGCDICQTGLPADARCGTPAGAASGAPRDAEAAQPPLVDLLRLRSAEFKQRYRATAMGWRGGAVLRRNAAVALGNALDRSAVGAADRKPLATTRIRWYGATPPGRSEASARRARLGTARRSMRKEKARLAREITTALRPSSRELEDSYDMIVRLTVLPLCSPPPSRRAAARIPSARPHGGASIRDLHSFSATMHAHVTMKSFPFLSADLVGTYYYKAPDKKRSSSPAAFRWSPSSSTSSTRTSSRRRNGADVYAVTIVSDDGTRRASGSCRASTATSTTSTRRSTTRPRRSPRCAGTTSTAAMRR